jgi:hypothetical protein
MPHDVKPQIRLILLLNMPELWKQADPVIPIHRSNNAAASDHGDQRVVQLAQGSP